MEIPKVVRTYVDAWSAGDLDAWLASFAPDGTYSDPNLPKPTLAHGLKSTLLDFSPASPMLPVRRWGSMRSQIFFAYGALSSRGPIRAP